MSDNLATTSPNSPAPTITKALFGILLNRETVDEFTLSNGAGTKVKIISWGGIVRSITVPDRDGKLADIVLGCDSLSQYEKRHPYFGTITGRFANRIAKGSFELDGARYQLAVNNGPNHLHGGIVGFDRRNWRAETETSRDTVSVILKLVSPDGDEGYPGEVTAEVRYTLTTTNELRIDYSAKTTKATPLNLTNHSYFNLAGHNNGDVLNHQLQVFADGYLPVDSTQIPTGEIVPVKNSPFDFTKPHAIGSRIKEAGGGYDHNFVVSTSSSALHRVARVVEPLSGRTLEVRSTKPGVQLYTGNHLSNERGKAGSVYNKYSGFCLETQYFPDTINQPQFPSSILRPGELYHHTTVFTFGVAK